MENENQNENQAISEQSVTSPVRRNPRRGGPQNVAGAAAAGQVVANAAAAGQGANAGAFGAGQGVADAGGVVGAAQGVAGGGVGAGGVVGAVANAEESGSSMTGGSGLSHGAGRSGGRASSVAGGSGVTGHRAGIVGTRAAPVTVAGRTGSDPLDSGDEFRGRPSASLAAGVPAGGGSVAVAGGPGGWTTGDVAFAILVTIATQYLLFSIITVLKNDGRN